MENVLMINGWEGFNSISYLMSGGNFHYTQDFIILSNQLLTTELIEQVLDDHPEYGDLARAASLGLNVNVDPCNSWIILSADIQPPIVSLRVSAADEFARLTLRWYKSMPDGHVKSTCYLILEIIPAYRLFVSSMRDKPKSRSKADVKKCRDGYTSALKGLLALLAALAHYNYAKVLLDDLILWQHQVNSMPFREFHDAVCWINDRGQGLDDFSESDTRSGKSEINSPTLGAVRIAWSISDYKFQVEASFRNAVNMPPKPSSQQRPPTDITQDLKEIRAIMRRHKWMSQTQNDNVIKT